MTETPNPHIVDADTLTGEMHPIRRCVIAIGSNMGERKYNLQGAVSALVDTPEVDAAALQFAHSVFRHASALGGWDSLLTSSVQGIPPPLRRRSA